MKGERINPWRHRELAELCKKHKISIKTTTGRYKLVRTVLKQLHDAERTAFRGNG